MLLLPDNLICVEGLNSKVVAQAVMCSLCHADVMLYFAGVALVLAFRGTEPLELADFQSDFDAVPESGEWGCLHPGFLLALGLDPNLNPCRCHCCQRIGILMAVDLLHKLHILLML